MIKDNLKEYLKTKGEPLYNYTIPDFEGADFVMKLTGDGMKEKYHSGDKIAIKILDNVNEIIFGMDYCVWLNDSVETTLARQILHGNSEETLLLHAYSPIREDMIIDKNKIKFIGRIIALIRTNL